MAPAGCACRGCGARQISVFHTVKGVPAHSMLLLPTREAALNCPKGDIELGFCQACGLISNLVFDPSLHEYSSHYEETQGFSSTFNAFHQRLATRLIARYDLHGKDIIEIGCGKGEFLTLLCEQGGNRGVGFDPSYVSGRSQRDANARITFIKDFYTEKYANYRGDFVCCKMTLEHIQHASDFIGMIRRSIGDRPDTIVFFQVPNVTRIVRELAFWDIYYEHCSYFSPGSLARLFRKCGFDVLNVEEDYGDQYLMIEACPGSGKDAPPLDQEDDLGALARDVAYFAEHCQQKLNAWRRDLQEISGLGRRGILWGSGSKGVAFLTALNIRHEIGFVVDINPYRQGTYMAGTGHEIVAPDFLSEYQPDVVIIMNPVYREEILQDLTRMGLAPRLITL